GGKNRAIIRGCWWRLNKEVPCLWVGGVLAPGVSSPSVVCSVGERRRTYETNDGRSDRGRAAREWRDAAALAQVPGHAPVLDWMEDGRRGVVSDDLESMGGGALAGGANRVFPGVCADPGGMGG